MYTMRSTRLPRIAILLTVAVFIVGLFLLLSGRGPSLAYDGILFSKSFATSALGYGERYHGQSSSDLNRVTNETLGFGKILVVGLPERTDKKDAMTLMSAMTGFHVEWVPGIKGESIVEKARPSGYKGSRLTETYLGSWRGHMEAVRKIVEEGIPSALIMEDDMDWDLRLKPQLELIAKGARAVFPSSSSWPYSPYGDDWDLLWLGHCGEPFPETLPENRNLAADHPGRAAMSRKYTILNDATVPAPEKLTGLVNWKEYPTHTRWVHISAAPICSFAYALSQQGARKILFGLSVNGIHDPYDNALAGMCRCSVDSLVKDRPAAGDSCLGLKCLSVTPPVFFHHRAKGSVAGDSDINKVVKDDKLIKQGKDGVVRDKGSTENIVWSMRLNLQNIIMGRPIESQF